MGHLNWLAIIIASLSAFVVGYFWYGPALFGKTWQRENGLSDETLKQSNMALVYGSALGLTFMYWDQLFIRAKIVPVISYRCRLFCGDGGDYGGDYRVVGVLICYGLTPIADGLTPIADGLTPIADILRPFRAIPYNI